MGARAAISCMEQAVWRRGRVDFKWVDELEEESDFEDKKE